MSSENIRKSKRNYGHIYNKKNISVQLDRDLIKKIKDKLDGKCSLKSYIESVLIYLLNENESSK